MPITENDLRNFAERIAVYAVMKGLPTETEEDFISAMNEYVDGWKITMHKVHDNPHEITQLMFLKLCSDFYKNEMWRMVEPREITPLTQRSFR